MYYEGPFEIDLCKIWDCETTSHDKPNSFGKLLQEIKNKLDDVSEDISNKEQQGGKVIIL